MSSTTQSSRLALRLSPKFSDERVETDCSLEDLSNGHSIIMEFDSVTDDIGAIDGVMERGIS
jgi:hypothetical protein